MKPLQFRERKKTLKNTLQNINILVVNRLFWPVDVTGSSRMTECLFWGWFDCESYLIQLS